MVFTCRIGTMELESLKMDVGVCRNLCKTEAALKAAGVLLWEYGKGGDLRVR